MTSEEFVLAILDRIGPWVVTALGVVTAYIQLRKMILDNTKKTEANLARTVELQEKTDKLEENVNGKMEKLLEEKDERIALAERLGHAEGKADVLEKNAAPTVVPVVVPPPVRDPQSRTRVSDLLPPPPRLPAERDPTGRLSE